VRIQIATALIAYLLLKLAKDAAKIVESPLAFARLVRANLMHRRASITCSSRRQTQQQTPDNSPLDLAPA